MVKTKTIRVYMTIRVNAALSGREALREVSTLINEQSGFLSFDRDGNDITVKASRLAIAKGADS